MPAGPTGVVKSEMGADMLGLRSLIVAVEVAMIKRSLQMTSKRIEGYEVARQRAKE